MANQIFINTDAVTLLDGVCQGINDLRRKSIKNFTIGDAPVFEIFLTSKDGAGDIQSDFSTFKLGIDRGSVAFTSGNVVVTGGGSGTTIAFGSLNSASTWQSAFTAETAANTTTALDTYKFHVKFTSNGARSLPTVTNTLDPLSSVSIQRLVTGTGSVKEEWLVQVFNNPIALTSSHTPITRTFNGASVKGVQMTLGLQTAAMVSALGASDSLTRNIEFEATDASSNQQTLFKVPFTVEKQVIGEGTPATAVFPNFLVSSDLDSFRQVENAVYVSLGRGNDGTGTREKRNKPFATITAAIAAASANDTIFIEDGNFDGEATNVVVNKSLTFHISPNATTCGLNCTSGTLTVRGGGTVAGGINQVTGTSIFVFDITCESLTMTGNGSNYIENAKVTGPTASVSGAHPIFYDLGSASGSETVFKNCRLKEANQNSIFKSNDSSGTVAFDGCTFETQAGSNAYILEMTNTNREPTFYLKDCVIMGFRSDAKLFYQSNTGRPTPIRYVGGATSINIESDPYSSTMGVTGNILHQDTNLSTYPYL